MKRIKALNGYTIYQAVTARDAENHNVQVGDFCIYLSSDIRDFGLSCSYPEWDGVDSLSVAVAMCNGSKHAVAVELAEELSNSTIQDMDLVLEIERRLDAGESLESVRDSYDTEEQCFVPEADQYCAVDQETGVQAYTWASSPAEAAANVFAGHDWRMIDLYMVHPVADMFLGEFARPEANDEPDEDLLDGDLEDVLNRALETGDRADANLDHDPDEVDLLVRAMRAADWSYDGLDLAGEICFGGPNCELVHFGSWPEVREWLEGVVFDDPEVSDSVESILHPERFAPEAGDRPDDEIACMLWEQDALEPGDYLLAADSTDIARIVSIDRTGTYPSYTVEHPDLSREQWGALHVSRMLGVTTASDRELRRRAVFVWDHLLPELKRCDLLAEEEAETAGLDRGGAEAVNVEYTDGTDGWEQPEWTVYYEGEIFPEDCYTPGARGISRNYHDHHAARKLCRFCEAHGIDVWLKNNRYGYTEHNGEVDC